MPKEPKKYAGRLFGSIPFLDYPAAARARAGGLALTGQRRHCTLPESA
jgi:hypothetical protein